MTEAIENLEKTVTLALRRSALFQALSRAFAYPDPATCAEIRELLDPLLASAAPWVEGLQPRFVELNEALASADPSQLEHEHVRLFGPGGVVSLAETSYGDTSRMLGKPASLADISGFYLAFEMEPQAGDTHPEDHLCMELEFMGVLALKEAYALAEGWDEQAEVTRSAQAKFVQDHLGSWVSTMARELAAAEPPAFYARLAEAVDELVSREIERLGVVPQRLEGRAQDREVGGDAIACPQETGEPAFPESCAVAGSKPACTGCAGPVEGQDCL